MLCVVQPGLLAKAVNWDSMYARGMAHPTQAGVEQEIEKFKASNLMKIKGSSIRSIVVLKSDKTGIPYLIEVLYETDKGEAYSKPYTMQITEFNEFKKRRESLLNRHGSLANQSLDEQEKNLEKELQNKIKEQQSLGTLALEEISLLENRLRLEVESAQALLAGHECCHKTCADRHYSKIHLDLHTVAQNKLIEMIEEKRKLADSIWKKVGELEQMLEKIKRN